MINIIYKYFITINKKLKILYALCVNCNTPKYYYKPNHKYFTMYIIYLLPNIEIEPRCQETCPTRRAIDKWIRGRLQGECTDVKVIYRCQQSCICCTKSQYHTDISIQRRINPCN